MSRNAATKRSQVLIPLSFVVIILSLLFFPFSSLGEIYKWTDEKGTVHFAEDPTDIFLLTS